VLACQDMDQAAFAARSAESEVDARVARLFETAMAVCYMRPFTQSTLLTLTEYAPTTGAGRRASPAPRKAAIGGPRPHGQAGRPKGRLLYRLRIGERDRVDPLWRAVRHLFPARCWDQSSSSANDSGTTCSWKHGVNGSISRGRRATGSDRPVHTWHVVTIAS
jgi:hypothetical protein